MRPRVAVIGGGITGLTAAHALLKEGAEVRIFEARPQVGGLAATQDFGPFQWDRFYHCILTSDKPLLELIDDIGLTPYLRWTATEVGFYSNNALHRMTRPADLLRFPCLSLAAKVRFGLGILYAGRICKGEGLDSVPLKEWILKVFGRTVFEEMWDPLLRCKLGEMRAEASASFLWSTIRRLYSTREQGLEKQERLGYVEGGYSFVFERLLDRIYALGGRVQPGVNIQKVEPTSQGIGLTLDGAFREFDACLMTIPGPATVQLVPALSEEYRRRLLSPKYLGMVCLALVLRRPLSPYYLTNVTQAAPFTGIVEMTNLIDRDVETAGLSLVYLPKYTSPGDPLFSAPDQEIRTTFIDALRKIHPTLTDAEVVSTHLFRERFVQPVPTLNYARNAPGVDTGIPHLFVANTTQIINDTLNNNAMVRIARNAASELLLDLQRGAGNAQIHSAADTPLPQYKEA